MSELNSRDGRLRSSIRAVRKGWKKIYAEWRRKRIHLDSIIAVTGSCGKSTTTKLTAAALAEKPGVYLGYGKNTPKGIRGAMFRMPASAKIWVQEVSGHKHDAMETSVRFIRPTIGVVTTIGMDHISNFDSPEDIAVSKGQLVEALPENGHAILNADDPLVAAMAGRTHANVITFGKAPDADIRLVSSSHGYPERLNLRVCAGEEVVDVPTRFVGERWTTSVLAALAAAHAVGVPLKQAAAGIETVEPLRFKDDVYTHNGMTFIVDSYKAPLWTVQSSVDIVAAAKAQRKVMIFGTISDYRGSARGKYVRSAKSALEAAQLVIFYGRHSQRVRRLKADYPDRLFMFETYKELTAFLRGALKAGDLIYIKASGSADHLERIVLDHKKPVICELTDCSRPYTCNHCRHLHGKKRWFSRTRQT
ncbi:Mur ligase family protein [Hoeflea prorocentri]|uniref:Mur ligase family protein n=1 Tax=Hoeflea prorocentri TaxID=1922333 RepID=UPI00227AA04C|nr:Mur ligase family protein [Hoeflea prorocentri]MCY6383473.1 Mur ligase family protein [Hoeflea prorocentri]